MFSPPLRSHWLMRRGRVAMDRRSFLKGGVGGLLAPPLLTTACSGQDLEHSPAKAAPWTRGFSPAPIAGQGYQLVFDDEFDAPLDIGEDGHRWCPNLWYERPASSRQYGVRESCLYLRCFHDDDWRGCQLTTEWASARSGTFFRGGYFEARIKCAPAWNAFWLFSVSHSRGFAEDDPEHWAGELDILETDSARPHRFYGTLHRNTAGPRSGGPPDDFNRNHSREMASALLGQWHTYAALWTRDDVTWFVDDQETIRCRAFESSWQDMFLILDLVRGGVEGKPAPPPETDMIEMLVDWVRVWQQPQRGDRMTAGE
jgi:hypothetical protein